MAEKKKSTKKKKAKEEIITPPLRKLSREEKMAYLISNRKEK